ncbi:hypothetical protein niasHT_002670 [Heterodera trifolii]|uniref:Uncharacterized protein n=1 Tax=Heterodera trifolii TaxID=157864 RepID=A0ABD2M383_9BILA
MIRLCLFLIGCTASVVYSATDSASSADADKNSSSKDFQGQKLSWRGKYRKLCNTFKDDDGLEVKIIRPIAQGKVRL